MSRSAVSMPSTPSLGTPIASPAPQNLAPPIAIPEHGKRGILARARTFGGERLIGRLLRTGAILSGAMFLSSLGLELLPDSPKAIVAADMLRKSGLAVLVVTPIARLATGATLLAFKGEWKYALYGAGVLGLLALAVGAGFGA
ncbi:MAG: DUF1634 domain-containing protein [Myxococcaceae bacterium]